MMRVPVMLTCSSLLPEAVAPQEMVGPKGWDSARGQLAQERVRGGEPQRDTGADDERGVDQAGQQEHLGLQLVHQLGLTRGGLEVLAAHHADADAGADGTQTDDQAGGQRDEADDLFHLFLLLGLLVVDEKREAKRVLLRRPQAASVLLQWASCAWPMYTSASIMNTNACSVMIRMWKIAHAVPAMMWPTARPLPVALSEKAPPMRAISRKISSPAYMLPNSRMPCDTVLAMNSIICIRKLNGHSSGCAPKGAVNSSCSQPPRPLIFTL